MIFFIAASLIAICCARLVIPGTHLPFPRFPSGVSVQFGGETGGFSVLLSNQQAANLQELVSLVTGELVGVTNGGKLAIRALGGGLQTLKLSSIRRQVILLLIQPSEERIVGRFLRFRRQATVFIHRCTFGIRATAAIEAGGTPVIRYVLELAQVGIEAAELVLVMLKRIGGLDQVINRGLCPVPDIGRWS